MNDGCASILHWFAHDAIHRGLMLIVLAELLDWSDAFQVLLLAIQAWGARLLRRLVFGVCRRDCLASAAWCSIVWSTLVGLGIFRLRVGVGLIGVACWDIASYWARWWAGLRGHVGMHRIVVIGDAYECRLMVTTMSCNRRQSVNCVLLTIGVGSIETLIRVELILQVWSQNVRLRLIMTMSLIHWLVCILRCLELLHQLVRYRLSTAQRSYLRHFDIITTAIWTSRNEPWILYLSITCHICAWLSFAIGNISLTWGNRIDLILVVHMLMFQVKIDIGRVLSLGWIPVTTGGSVLAGHAILGHLLTLR